MQALKRGLAPKHAGIIFKEMIIDELPRMSVAAAAKALGVSRAHLGDVTKGESSITPKLAVKIGITTKTSPKMWLDMQENYDLWYAENSPELTEGLMEGSLAFA